jgi:centrosomal protein CEP104
MEECSYATIIRQCPRCHECVSENGYEDHIRLSACREAKSPDEANRCPLCHMDIPPGEKGWKYHLLWPPGCTAHYRTRMKLVS